GVTSTLVRGGSLQRNAGAIAGDTIGAMVIAQMATKSVAPAKVKMDEPTNGSTATLYGTGGDVDALVARAGYNADPGQQFGWSANAQFTPAASSFDATAAGLGITPDEARALIAVDNGASLVNSSSNTPGVDVRAVPYPQIAVHDLPAMDIGSISAAPSLWDGLRNIGGAYEHGDIDLTDALKMGAEQVGENGRGVHPKQFVLDRSTELSAWGVHHGGLIGGAALYGGSVIGGIADGLLPDSFGEGVISAGAAIAGGPLIGRAVAGLESLAVRSAYTSFLADDVGSVLQGFGSQVERMVERTVPALRMYAVPEDMVTSSRLEPPVPRIDISNEFSINRYGGGVSIDYLDAEYGSHGLNAYIDQSQRLSFEVRAQGDIAALGSGTDMFASMMLRLDREGIPVNGITGTWISGTDSVNAAEYGRNLAAGMSKEDAAINTWTGRMASRYGFTSVTVPDPILSNTQFAYFKKLGQ
ncbi:MULTISPECIES: hypothetical protein, partial [unclassified Caballeronia]|uniref:hypothetical protein n=1 Tax=unclassified Caballeronia TaxID=2646786 RepID=UPI0028671DDD